MPDLNLLYSTYVESPKPDNLDALLTKVRQVAVSVMHNDDAVQEFLIELWPLLPTLKVPNFQGWIQNRLRWGKANDHRARKAQALREQQAPVMYDDEGVEMTDDEALSLLDYQNKQREPKKFEADLSSITDRFILQVAELMRKGFTQAEIADWLGVPASTLRKRLQRYREHHKSSK
jgi:DNA-directed RNA polymerase specialized sigma24 family protein